MEYAISREEIERTIYNLIRLNIVAMGYIADVAAYQPSNPANIAAYKAANEAIRLSGKQIIEPFGVSSNERREEKRINKIFINLRQMNAGSVSLWGDSVDASLLTPGTFDRTFAATSTTNLIYDIRTVTESVEYDRVCNRAILQGLTASRVGQAFLVFTSINAQDPERFMLLRFINSTDIKSPQFFERLYSFEVIDAWIDDWGYVPYITGLPPISEVETDAIVNNEQPFILLTVQ